MSYAYPHKGDRCKVYYKGKYVCIGTVDVVYPDSDDGFVVYMKDLTYANGNHGDNDDFSGAYRFVCETKGDRRRKTARRRKSSRKTRRSYAAV